MLNVEEEAKQPLDFRVVERVFRRLSIHPDDAELRVPTHLKGWRFGGQAALIHFIANWGARVPEPRLVLYATNLEKAEEQLPNLGNTHHGLAALAVASEVMIDSIPKVTISQKEKKALLLQLFAPLYPDDIDFIKDNIENELEEHSKLGAWRGDRVLFLCSRRQNREFPFYFYHLSKGESPTIKSRVDFCRFFKDVVARQKQQRIKSWEDGIQNSIGEIIYELFKNTHEHGGESIFGVPIANSLRGVMIALHSKTASDPLRSIKDMTETPVKTYLKRFDRDEAEPIEDFLEINVFDNGPGLARKWLLREIDGNLSLKEELEAISQCWGKYNTTSDRDGKGLGLYRVARTLSECGGFLRIRTGRLSLYRDFTQHPFPDEKNNRIDPQTNLFEHSLTLMDFANDSINPEELTAFTPVEGLLLTMLIPLDRKRASL